MGLLLWVLVGWTAVTAVAVLGVTAVCRSGHAEDVARGFVDLTDGATGGRVPEPRPASRPEVTHG